MILFFIALALPHLTSSQNSFTSEPKFEVHRVFPPISITRENLHKAHTLIDLNRYYKLSWIREYISVEILASCQGNNRKSVSKNDTLSLEQKEIMHAADVGTDISVMVQYIPENTLRDNEPKMFDFAFTVDPESEASYSGGEQQLIQYLKEHAIDKIPDDTFTGYALAAVKFTIDEEGQIIDAHIFESSKDETTDALLLETIRNMPQWKPAEYANGVKTRQDFVLTVGNMENCMMNLLNIRHLDPEN